MEPDSDSDNDKTASAALPPLVVGGSLEKMPDHILTHEIQQPVTYDSLPEWNLDFQWFPSGHKTSYNWFLFFDDPQSALGSFLYSTCIQIFVFLTLVFLILASYISFYVDHYQQYLNFDYMSLGVFAFDYFVRLFLCPINMKLRWAIRFFNILDLLSVIVLIVNIINTNNTARIFKVLRLFRLLRIVQYNDSAILFTNALYFARKGIFLLCFLVTLVSLFAGTMIFFAENARSDIINGTYYMTKGTRIGQPSFYQNVPMGIWWAIVTLTTVGYGDTYPSTSAGRFIGVCTMIMGVITIALPVAVISNSYSEALALESNTPPRRYTYQKLGVYVIKKLKIDKVYFRLTGRGKHGEDLLDEEGRLDERKVSHGQLLDEHEESPAARNHQVTTELSSITQRMGAMEGDLQDLANLVSQIQAQLNRIEANQQRSVNNASDSNPRKPSSSTPDI